MLIVQVLDDVIMFVLVNFEDDGFDGGVAFDQHSWSRRVRSVTLGAKVLAEQALPFTALGIIRCVLRLVLTAEYSSCARVKRVRCRVPDLR